MTAAERRINALRRGIARRRKELDSCGKRLAKNTVKSRRALDVQDFVEAAGAEDENSRLARQKICLESTIWLEQQWLKRTVEEVTATGGTVPASDPDLYSGGI